MKVVVTDTQHYGHDVHEDIVSVLIGSTTVILMRKNATTVEYNKEAYAFAVYNDGEEL